MRFRRDLVVATTAVAMVIGAAAAVTPRVSDAAAASGGTYGTIRRLTQDQYRQTIADLFGTDITIVGRFEPDNRQNGLMAVGAAAASVSGAGAEQYDTMARTIAAQIVDPARRGTLLPCVPADESKPDDKCAKQAITEIGRFLYRRPLTKSEVNLETKVANEAAKQFGNFYTGLEASFSGMLVSPEFLFIVERGAPDRKTGELVLDGFSRAQRLSYLLWNSTPDDLLLKAAESGELDKPEGVAKQVDRLMNSPRFERGTRAFFNDWFAFSAFDDLIKDPEIYPKFSAPVAVDAREQTMRLLVDHLVRRDADYKELLTTRRTFMTRRLGAIYRVPVASRSGWEPYEFGPDDNRAGLLGQLSFLTLYSHPGRSSPTLRGKAIREILLCQEVAPPPPNVDFGVVNDVKNQEFRTGRDRLAQHALDPTCAGCHKVIDPMGLALENFDSSGEYRETENGAAIDATGDYNGQTFTGVSGLGRALAEDPSVSACMVEQFYSYGLGRKAHADDEAVKPFVDSFAKDGSYRNLVRAIATSEAFYRTPLRGTKVAGLTTSTTGKR